MLLPKGSKFVCPDCGIDVFELKEVDIDNQRSEYVLKAKEVKGLNGYKPKEFEPVICPNCNSGPFDIFNLDNYKKSDKQ